MLFHLTKKNRTMQYENFPWIRIISTTSLVLGLSACNQSNSNTTTTPPPAKVSVFEVQQQTMSEQTELPGRTVPYLIAEVRPQVGGILKSRLFTEGGDVKAGMPLYQIDPTIYEANLSSAKASLEKAKANLISTEIRNTRFQELSKQNAVSQQERDDAYAAFKQAQADLASAKAAVLTAQTNLEYTKVKAPIGGRVGRSDVTAGALVQQGQNQALTTIQQLDPIYVDVTQSTKELLALKRALADGELKSAGKEGVKVSLQLEDGTQYEHTGKLLFSEATVDTSTGTVTVRAVFPNPQKELLPGMYVRAQIQQGVRQHAILIPQKTLARDNTGSPVVYVVNKDNAIEKRKVQTVKTVGDQWLLESGLESGEKIVLEGIQKVKPGQTVELETTPKTH